MSQNMIGGKLTESVVLQDPRNGTLYMTHTPTDVSLGLVPGAYTANINGVRASIPVAPGGVMETHTTALVSSAAGEAMTIRSTAADVGAVVAISALGPNYERLPSFTATLNGTTPVAIGTYTRINGMRRVSGEITGDVLIESSGQVRAPMAAGSLVMSSATFTVPTGYRLAVEAFISAMTKDGGADVSCVFMLQGKPVTATTFGRILSVAAYRSGASSVELRQSYPTGFSGPLDVRVLGTASAANVDAQSYVSGVLIDNTIYPPLV